MEQMARPPHWVRWRQHAKEVNRITKSDFEELLHRGMPWTILFAVVGAFVGFAIDAIAGKEVSLRTILVTVGSAIAVLMLTTLYAYFVARLRAPSRLAFDLAKKRGEEKTSKFSTEGTLKEFQNELATIKSTQQERSALALERMANAAEMKYVNSANDSFKTAKGRLELLRNACLFYIYIGDQIAVNGKREERDRWLKGVQLMLAGMLNFSYFQDNGFFFILQIMPTLPKTGETGNVKDGVARTIREGQKWLADFMVRAKEDMLSDPVNP